ncbi:condensation domain-containing protein [Sphaerisporangium sp. NPDC088356]|uniref:condensation domain-containing protein n=1 Tax=Sphaerisporangium sp. NPDC088356 TaxID=3154871 RepID=UPI00342190D2
MSAAKNANLCWGQRYMWLRYHQLPPRERHDTHIVLHLEMPYDVTFAHCRTAVNYLTRRHEALRTTYHLDGDGDPRQRVHSPAAVPVIQVTTERDGTAAPGEVVEKLTTTEFDLSTEWPIRACVITTGGVPKQLVLVLNHLAVDVWTVRQIKRELKVQCAGFSSRRPAALEPVRHQPMDLTRYESSPEAAAMAGRAMAFWREEISKLPADTFGARRVHDAEPSARGATLTSPSMLDASRRIGARHQAWPSLVHVTAYTMLMAAYTGSGTVGHLSFTSNRDSGQYSDVMTCMFSPLLMRVDCHDDPTFTELLRRVARHFERAQANSYVPYDEVVELVSRESSRRGQDVRIGSELNFIKQASRDTKARRTKFTWSATPSGWAHHGGDTYFRIDEWRDAVVVTLKAVSTVMDADAMERFLRGYEAVFQAHDDPSADLRISDVARLAGFAPPPPAGDDLAGLGRIEAAGDEAAGDEAATPMGEAERILAAVVRQVNGLDDVDLSGSYTAAGGRALRIPGVLAALAGHGWEGISVHQLTSARPLRALAARLTPITPITPIGPSTPTQNLSKTEWFHMNDALADRPSNGVSKTHQLVASEQELRRALDRELSAFDLDKLVIMGGHFMLFEDETSGRLVPGVIEEQKSDTMRRRIAGRVGIFPGYSWTMSVDLLKSYSETCDDVRLLLLINDWQYVPAAGRPASELRAEFFEEFTRLPAEYEKVLRNSGLSPDRVLSSRKHALSFPETWLKYRFQKAADKFVKQGLLEKRVLDSARNDTEVAFLDPEGNYRTLISCGITGCAGEITEMISEVYRAGYRAIVIFAPGECLAPVQTGVDIALNLYRLPGMLVVIADPGGSGEMSTDEIYSKLVTVSTFRS